VNSWQQRERALETLAKETGYIRKPHGTRLRVALAFPNTYWVGMSNLGFQTVYRLFNDMDDIVCERVFLPPKQELAGLLAARTPLVSLVFFCFFFFFLLFFLFFFFFFFFFFFCLFGLFFFVFFYY
jgi:hypothetical protein